MNQKSVVTIFGNKNLYAAILGQQEFIMDDAHWKLERAVNALCYDGFLPDEIAEMVRSIAQDYHAEIDERIAQDDEPEN